MSYVKAKDVLPASLLEAIQSYIEGEYIYIPRKEDNKKSWGEKTQSKKNTYIRNCEIYRHYQSGVSVKTLSKMYYLSPKSIQRIVLEFKNKLNE